MIVAGPCLQGPGEGQSWVRRLFEGRTNANLPSLVHHWLMTHAELGTFGSVVSSGTP